MKLSRDLSGHELATLLRAYGYGITRQTGSDLRLTSTLKGKEHHLTVPAHRALRVGALSEILADVAGYLEIDRAKLAEELSGK